MSSFDSSCRYVCNPDLIATEMDGETVMMSIERGNYYGIGGVGSRIWCLLAQPMDLAALVEVICAEYRVDAATCSADLSQFLGEMLDQGLIKPAEV